MYEYVSVQVCEDIVKQNGFERGPYLLLRHKNNDNNNIVYYRVESSINSSKNDQTSGYNYEHYQITSLTARNLQ